MEKINTKEILMDCHDYMMAKCSDNAKKDLHIFQLGNDPASNKYVNNKIKKCEENGICTYYYKFGINDKNYDSVEYMNTILNDIVGTTNGKVMVQLPASDKVDFDCIHYLADVDGLSSDSQNILYTDKVYEFIKHNKYFNVPATARACLYLTNVLYQKYLAEYRYDIQDTTTLKDATVLIIGRSNLVGKPLARLLDICNITTLQAHSHTSEKSLLKMIDMADIIVTAVGKHGVIDSSMFDDKHKKVIIDVGINFDENGKMCGDFKPLEQDKNKPIYYTPVPGGVGLFTVENLIYNVLEIPVDFNI